MKKFLSGKICLTFVIIQKIFNIKKFFNIRLIKKLLANKR